MPSDCSASYLELHSCLPIFGLCNQNMGQVQGGANSQKNLHSALNYNQLGSQSLPAGPLQTDSGRNGFINTTDCALCLLGQCSVSRMSYVILESKSRIKKKTKHFFLDMLHIPQQLLRKEMI